MLKAIYAELGAYKGLNGKTATVGGCLEYTGAPYYAALSSLRAVRLTQGSDLAHVFCTQGAGAPIKSYSPEIIVHPVLTASNENPQLGPQETWGTVGEQVAEKVVQWLPALHTLIVGPGLGRDPFLADIVTPLILTRARSASIHHSDKLLVIDADGLNVVCKHLETVRGYRQAVLTPNIVEFGRLWAAAIPDPQPAFPGLPGMTTGEVPIDTAGIYPAVRLAQELGGCTLLLKGAVDIITNGVRAMVVTTRGSQKRCGGIGDVLSGVISTTLHLATSNKVPDAVLEACVAGSVITRRAADLAFQEAQWSLTAPDVLRTLPAALRQVLIESSTQSLL